MSLHKCNVNRDGIDTDVLRDLPMNLIKKLAAKSSIRVDGYNDALKHAMKAKAGVEGKRLRDFIMEVPGIEAHIIRIEKMKDGGGLDIRELNTPNPVGVYSNHNANNRTTIASSIKPLKQSGGSIMNDFGKEFAIMPKNQGTEMNNMKYLQNYIQTSTLGGKYKKGGKTSWKRLPADQIFMVGGKVAKHQSGGEQGWSPEDDKPQKVNGVELTKSQYRVFHNLKKTTPDVRILWGQDNAGNWGKFFYDSKKNFLSDLDGATGQVAEIPTEEERDNAETIGAHGDNLASKSLADDVGNAFEFTTPEEAEAGAQAFSGLQAWKDQTPGSRIVIDSIEGTASVLDENGEVVATENISGAGGTTSSSSQKPTRQAPTRQLKKAKPVDLSTMEEHEGYMVDAATKKVYTMDGKLVTDTTFANNLLSTFAPKQEVMTLPEKEYDLQGTATANLIANAASADVSMQNKMKDKVVQSLSTPTTTPEDTRTQAGRLIGNNVGRAKQGVNKVLFGKAAQALTGLFTRSDEKKEARSEKKALRKVNRSK